MSITDKLVITGFQRFIKLLLLRDIHAAHIVGIGLNLKNPRVKAMNDKLEKIHQKGGKVTDPALKAFENIRHRLEDTNPTTRESNINLEKIIDNGIRETFFKYVDAKSVPTPDRISNEVSFLIIRFQRFQSR